MPEKLASIIAHPILNMFAGVTTLLVYFGLRSNTVSEKRCKEHREDYEKNIEGKIDAVKADTEKQWDALQDIRDVVIKTKTIVEERGHRRE